MRMVELLKKIIHKSAWKLLSVQTVNAKYGLLVFMKMPFIDAERLNTRK
jgi:hypothetical protein